MTKGSQTTRKSWGFGAILARRLAGPPAQLSGTGLGAQGSDDAEGERARRRVGWPGLTCSIGNERGGALLPGSAAGGAEKRA